MDFSKFDDAIDQEKLKKQMDEAPEYDDVPKGTYIAAIKKMEVKLTNAKDKLMFSVQMQIIETVDAPKKQDKRYVFFNRVICGNKVTEKYDDGKAIKGVISWVKKLLDEGDELEFQNYTQFAGEILDIYQDVCPNIEVKINYDPDAFNPVTIVEVFDK